MIWKQVSLLLVSISACSCSSASACLIRCTVICLQFSRASGEYSFHHLPIFPAWNRKLATTLLAPMLLAATKLGQTRHCFRNLTRLCLALILIFDGSYKPMWKNKAQKSNWFGNHCAHVSGGLAQLTCTWCHALGMSCKAFTWLQSPGLRGDTEGACKRIVVVLISPDSPWREICTSWM